LTESAEASRKDAEAYARDKIRRDDLLRRWLSRVNASDSWCVRCSRCLRSTARQRAQHVPPQGVAGEDQKLEAELRLLEERAHQVEERRLSDERMMQERLRLVGERQHSSQVIAGPNS